jgi:hypothetical protein
MQSEKILNQHGVKLPKDDADDCIVSMAIRLNLLQGRNEANFAQVTEVRGQRNTLRAAVQDAIISAENEGIDRYCGTDEPREFLVILKGAEQAAETPNPCPTCGSKEYIHHETTCRLRVAVAAILLNCETYSTPMPFHLLEQAELAYEDAGE